MRKWFETKTWGGEASKEQMELKMTEEKWTEK